MTDTQKQALLFYKARTSVGMSQENLALELGVSKKTISNWERGFSSPTISDMMQAFRILGVNPAAYLNAYLYSDQQPSTAEHLHDIVDALPGKLQEELVYIFTGEHGMPPYYAIQLLAADLHLSLRARLMIAQQIMTEYEIEQSLGELRFTDGELPDIKALEAAIAKAMESIKQGNESYYPGGYHGENNKTPIRDIQDPCVSGD